jgi:hypothetical protein
MEGSSSIGDPGGGSVGVGEIFDSGESVGDGDGDSKGVGETPSVGVDEGVSVGDGFSISVGVGVRVGVGESVGWGSGVGEFAGVGEGVCVGSGVVPTVVNLQMLSVTKPAPCILFTSFLTVTVYVVPGVSFALGVKVIHRSQQMTVPAIPLTDTVEVFTVLGSMSSRKMMEISASKGTSTASLSGLLREISGDKGLVDVIPIQ